MKFLNLILIIILSTKKSEEQNPDEIKKVNVNFTQISNANYKISLICNKNDDCSSIAGIAILTYEYNTSTNSIQQSQIRLPHISLSNNQTIERDIYIPVHDTNLTFISPFKIGQTKVNYTVGNITFNVSMPTIIFTNVTFLSSRGPLKLEFECNNCDSNIFIPEGTEIPDDTFYISNKKNEKAYLRSCTPMNEIKSNFSNIIICIPFSSGNTYYENFYNITNKIGFININISKISSFAGADYYSINNECVSFLSGSPIYYNVNKEKNPTFTLTSKKKINENSLVLFANDTIIHKNQTNSQLISVCNKIDDYTLTCGIDFVHFPHLKQDDEDVNVYYIYEKKYCGFAFTGAVVLSSYSFYIKNWNIGYFLFWFILFF